MKRITTLTLMALAGLALAHAGGSQFPAQRFSKVTADSLALTSGTQVTTVAAPDVARWNSLQSGIREELDPVFGASAAGAITGQDVASWNSFVVNNAWLTNALYPAEVLSLRSLNLSRIFGTPYRLLVQGYKDAAWSGNLTLNVGSGSSAEIRAAHLFTNLPFFQTPHYMMLDHDTGNVWWVYTEPAGSYWLAYKFDVPTQVNRVRHYKFGGWGNPWPSFTVWGSDDSTNGSDGHWTQISGAFTLSSNMEAVNTCDFAQNTRSFLWVKLVGAPKTVVENAGVREIEFESYQPAPDKRFWVDARGNPGTDGTMTAAALTLTTNSLTATVTLADIQAWENYPWGWTDDNQNITAKYKNVILGAATAGAERFKVIGFQGSGYTANLARLAGTTYYAISNYTNQSWYAPPASFNGVIYAASGGSGDGWAPGAGSPVWLAFKFQNGVSKVINKLTLWREGDQSIPWDNYSIYGSNDTTDGANGTWELVAGPFLPRIGGGPYYQTLSEDVVFNDNKKAFSAYKIIGPPRSGRVLEVEAYTYAPTPDKSFYVDAQGNPGTDGAMTAAALALTTNSLTQTITQQDVRNWNTNLAVWSPLVDGAAITSRQAQVAIGATAIGDQRLLVQGYLPTSTYNPFSERSLTSFDNNVFVFTSSNWNNTPSYPVFDGMDVGEWWRPNTGAQWIATKNPSGLARVVNRVSFYQGGYWVPFDTFQVLGSNDSTNGGDGTWTLLGGPFLARNGAGWENYDLPTNTAAFKWHKIAGSVANLSSRLTYEIRFATYSPAPDKKFTVDAYGNPGTDGSMTAGTYCFTPLAAAPDSPTTGTAYFDNPSRKLRVWDGSAWQDAW